AVPGVAQHGRAAPVGLFGLGLEPAHEPCERVEAHDPLRIGDEVGERVDVVVDVPAGAVVDQVFDAADVDAGGGDDALHLGHDLRRRRVALDLDAGPGCVRRAGGALQLGAVETPADVRRAEVERVAGRVHADAVEEAAPECLHAHDAAVP